MHTNEMIEGFNKDPQFDNFEESGDECGVFGVWAPDQPVANITYTALNGLQHRGESAAGIFVHDEAFGIWGHKGVGTVPEAISEAASDSNNQSPIDQISHSTVAIGHVRYSTSPENSVDAAQPFKGDRAGLAVSHNGHIEGLDMVAGLFGVDVGDGVSDSHKLSLVLDARTAELGDLEKALHDVLPILNGAFCLTITDGQRLVGARDPWGFHPLAIGRLIGAEGYVLASEQVVFASIGAEFVRDVEPGEIVVADQNGLSSSFIDRREVRQTCSYEFVYTARVDGVIDGVPIQGARKNLGRSLAEDHPVDADAVIGMPDSGMAAAFGYAEASGLPLVQGVVKNPYAGRSFLQRAVQRTATLKDKARIIPEEVVDRRLVVVDDSLIKGNTMRAFTSRLRDAGALEVHIRLSSPRYRFPCFMGMDTGDSSELIARRMTDEEICAYLGADSVGFNSVDRVEQAIMDAARTNQLSIGKICTACTTGEYPFPVPGDETFIGMPRINRKQSVS